MDRARAGWGEVRGRVGGRGSMRNPDKRRGQVGEKMSFLLLRVLIIC